MKAGKWIVLGVVVIALVVAARLLPVVAWMKSFSTWAGHLGLVGFIIFVLVYALATVLFVPGWPLTVGAGFTFGLLIGTAAVSLGSILGASCAFLIARFLWSVCCKYEMFAQFINTLKFIQQIKSR